jgi:glycosyltransferase involved in cell wall biosynthesis
MSCPIVNSFQVRDLTDQLSTTAIAVSIIMLTYNRPKYIERAIHSVVKQDFAEWELIIVQDGDEKITEQILSAWIARDTRIRHFRRERPGNIGSALNFGIWHARGKFIAILDDDDQWLPIDKLSKQISFLEGHPEYVGCGGGVIVLDESGKEQMSYSKPQQDQEIRSKALFANPMAHSTTLYRKSAAEAVGLYEESIADFQDWDFWLKMAKSGKLFNFQEPLMYYTLWRGGSSYRKLRSNARSAVRIVNRHSKEFRSHWWAQVLAYIYLAYAYLPSPIRLASYSLLSRLKKRLFASSRT